MSAFPSVHLFVCQTYFFEKRLLSPLPRNFVVRWEVWASRIQWVTLFFLEFKDRRRGGGVSTHAKGGVNGFSTKGPNREMRRLLSGLSNLRSFLAEKSKKKITKQSLYTEKLSYLKQRTSGFRLVLDWIVKSIFAQSVKLLFQDRPPTKKILIARGCF